MPNVYMSGDMIEVQMIGSIYSSECMNVLHFSVKQNNLTTLQVGFELMQGWMDRMRNIQSTAWRWEGMKMRRVQPNGIGDYESYMTGIRPGLYGSAGMPPQVAALFSVQTTDASVKPLRGRIYVPGTPISPYIDGGWTQAFVGTCNQVAGWIRDSFKVGGSSAMLTQQVKKKSSSAAAGMTQYVLRFQPGIQRSRRINF